MGSKTETTVSSASADEEALDKTRLTSPETGNGREQGSADRCLALPRHTAPCRGTLTAEP